MVGVHGCSQLGELLFPWYQKYPHALFIMFCISEIKKKKKRMLLTLLEIKIIKWHLTEFSDFYSFLNQTYYCYIILNICET